MYVIIYLLHWQGMMELSILTLQKGSVKLFKERWESGSALRPSLELQLPPAPWSLAPVKISHCSTVEKDPADDGRADVVKEELLGGACQIEPFSIPVKELKSCFETLGDRKLSAGRFCGWKWFPQYPACDSSDVGNMRKACATMPNNLVLQGDNSTWKVQDTAECDGVLNYQLSSAQIRNSQPSVPQKITLEHLENTTARTAPLPMSCLFISFLPP